MSEIAYIATVVIVFGTLAFVFWLTTRDTSPVLFEQDDDSTADAYIRPHRASRMPRRGSAWRRAVTR